MKIEAKKLSLAVGALLAAGVGYMPGAVLRRALAKSARAASTRGNKYNGEDGPRAIARRKRQIERGLINPVFPVKEKA